jgi:hypothetical protein
MMIVMQVMIVLANFTTVKLLFDWSRYLQLLFKWMLRKMWMAFWPSEGKLVLCVCWFEISEEWLKRGKGNTCIWFPLREQNESLWLTHFTWSHGNTVFWICVFLNQVYMAGSRSLWTLSGATEWHPVFVCVHVWSYFEMSRGFEQTFHLACTFNLQRTWKELFSLMVVFKDICGPRYHSWKS